FKAVEQAIASWSVKADAGVLHDEAQGLRPLRRGGVDGQADEAGGCEFDRIGDQIGQYLFQANCIAVDPGAGFGRYLDDELQALVARGGGVEQGGFFDDAGQIEGFLLQVQPSGLDPGQVENVAEQGLQGAAGRLDQVQHLMLGGAQFRSRQRLGHADDAVQRRADLVAHIGQEAALGAIGGFGGVASLGQSFGAADHVGDVRTDGDQTAAGGATVLDTQPAIADLKLARALRIAALGQSFSGPGVFAADGFGIDARLQADVEKFFKRDADLQGAGQVGADIQVSLVPDLQPIVGVIDAQTVGHGVNRLQHLPQHAAARPPHHAGQEGCDQHRQADADHRPQADEPGRGGGFGQQHAGRRGDGGCAHADEMQPADAQRRNAGSARQRPPVAP
uniref:Flagellar hook-associated protein 1 n=1 Tax=Parastrongyloides trichosuri TaxID=131310 RepID=A0A0N4ZCW1_PARTI